MLFEKSLNTKMYPNKHITSVGIVWCKHSLKWKDKNSTTCDVELLIVYNHYVCVCEWHKCSVNGTNAL